MKYFAYGSNMDIDRMKKRKIKFTKREHAILRGQRVEFNKVACNNPKSGYANIVEDLKGIVEGILYTIGASDIKKLDSFEGVPEHYFKTKVTVELDNGEEIEAITYMANPDKVKEGLKPTKEYFAHLLKGSDLLSREYIRKLKNHETL